MRRAAWCLVGLFACESSKRTRPLCDRLAKLCDADLAGECPTDRDLADLERRVGKPVLDEALACVQAADECLAAIGCLAAVGQAAMGGASPPWMGRAAATSQAPLLHFERVEARPGPDRSLEVIVDVEVIGPVGGGNPYLEIESRCEDRVDRHDAFVGQLAGQPLGARRAETAYLHAGAERLAAPPAGCELTLTVRGGVGDPARYCFDGAWTNPGGC